MSTTKTKKNPPEESTNEDTTNPQPPMCGIVMPIAGFDGYPESHWKEVLSILKDSAAEAGFNANLVSHAEESGIIQKRIIENLYKNEMVICDISGKNANVMLELGIRLAFDKPTIVVKDDATSFSFDITPMEHIIYRRDLRFHSILEFKNALKAKIEATHKKALDKSLVGFIKSFGDFESVKINEKEVSSQQFIFDKLAAIEQLINKPKPQSISVAGFNSGLHGFSNLEQQGTVRVSFESTDLEAALWDEIVNSSHVTMIKLISRHPVKSDGQPGETIYDISYKGRDSIAKIYAIISKYTQLKDGIILK